MASEGDRDAPPPAGACRWLGPQLRAVLAPNPSPMTHWGTNSYLVGRGEVALVDPGPDDERHLAAILAALAPGERISHILVTHAHVDHSALAPALARRTGAAVLAFGDAGAGRSAVMTQLAAAGLAGGGEGVDAGFAPDLRLGDGAEVTGPGWRIRAHHMPGHFGNHLCLEWQGTVFTGDLVMGWASSLVSPPDGDVTDFMASLDRLEALAPAVLMPGHGAPVTAPIARIGWLRAHRRAREAAILAALGHGPLALGPLTALVYADLAPAMHGAAARNLFAHLVDLAARDRITALPALGPDAVVARA